MAPTAPQGEKRPGTAHLETASVDELQRALHEAMASGHAVQMRSELDDLPILKAIRIYWRIALICMLAAFAAALEGYRALSRPAG